MDTVPNVEMVTGATTARKNVGAVNVAMQARDCARKRVNQKKVVVKVLIFQLPYDLT